LIVDNPMDTHEDIAATVDLLYRLPRPSILNAFPLMAIPGTELARLRKKKVGFTLSGRVSRLVPMRTP
jgi:coproporphyrinogen III oxidase-like Fe-S oxidoreductase